MDDLSKNAKAVIDKRLEELLVQIANDARRLVNNKPGAEGDFDSDVNQIKELAQNNRYLKVLEEKIQALSAEKG